MLLSQGVMFGALWLVLGIRLWFGGWKDRMLIQYFDQVTNQQEAPNG